MTEPRKNAPKTRGKPFETGNPGRPRGARHRTTLAIEALLDGQHAALTKAAIDKALTGDPTALRLCLDRLAPPRRDAPVSFEMPPIATVADTVAAVGSWRYCPRTGASSKPARWKHASQHWKRREWTDETGHTHRTARAQHEDRHVRHRPD
jgi:hypothetical protein